MSSTRLQLTEGVSVVSLPQVPADGLLISKLLTRMGEADIILDMISQTAPSSNQISLSFTILDADLVATLKVFREPEFEGKLKPLISSENTKIQLFDPQMDQKSGVAAAVIGSIIAQGIEILLITTSDLDISVAIPGVRQLDAIAGIKAVFNLE